MTLRGTVGQFAVYNLYHWVWSGIDWLYPPTCGGCGSPGTRWCPDCSAKTRQISFPICPQCGQPQPHGEMCDRCRQAPPPFRALRSWGIYIGPLRNAILRLKYKGDMGLGEALARPMIQLFFELEWRVDMVVPVPVGKARREERGYNQAALLAWPLALAIRSEFQPAGLKKVHETRSQVGLSAVERKKNVQGAFQANAGKVKSRTVLLVDDTTTTGATMQACSEALLRAGAQGVFGLTLAQTSSGGPV